MTFAKTAFDATVAGVVLVGPKLDRTIERRLIGMRDDEFEDYEVTWRFHDPVFSAAMSRLAPISQSQLFSDAEWAEQLITREFAPRVNVIPYLVVPLYGSDDLILGAVHLCRPPHRAQFGDAERRLAASFSALVSVHYARFRHSDGRPRLDLAPRELEVARLAARGYDNLVIASCLGIARETVKQTLRRVYRKLDVDSRAEMAVVLAQANLV